MRVSVVTLGCKVNQFESQALEDILQDKGCRVVSFGEDVDTVIVNSCTVTHRSDRDARTLVRRVRRAHPRARIVVTGCYAQVDPETLRDLGADLVVGARARDALPQLIESRAEGIHVSGAQAHAPLAGVPVRRFSGRTRAYLKVQDGCESFCTYCIVPYARGPSRSLPPDEVRSGLASLREGGHREVVLTGVHLGMWGRDLEPALPFSELLRSAEASGIPRIRLSSLEPREVTGDVVRALAGSPCLCPHLHIPLQCGSDRILESMGRPYTAAEFRATVEGAAAAVTGLCLGFDVIVGFPGEGDRDFGETYRLLAGLPFAYLHVFPFSPRRGTKAWDLPGQVPDAVVRERAATLRDLSGRKRHQFWERTVGSILGALPEGTVDGGTLRLRTRNYVPVRIPWSGAPPADEVTVELLEVAADGVRARLAASDAEGKGPIRAHRSPMEDSSWI